MQKIKGIDGGKPTGARHQVTTQSSEMFTRRNSMI